MASRFDEIDVPLTFTALVRYTMHPAEPDVGFMNRYPEVMDVLIGGKSVFRELTEAHFRKIEDEIREAE